MAVEVRERHDLSAVEVELAFAQNVPDFASAEDLEFAVLLISDHVAS